MGDIHELFILALSLVWFLVAHDCGYPLSCYTCRATRVAADFLDFIAFCMCSTGVALHPLKILVSHLPLPPVPGGIAPKFGSEKVSRYTGVSQLQLRVSRYTVQLRFGLPRRFLTKKRHFDPQSESKVTVGAQKVTSSPSAKRGQIGRREKTPTPKTRFSICTLLRTPGRFTPRPLPVYFTTKMSVVRPFSVLSKHELGP